MLFIFHLTFYIPSAAAETTIPGDLFLFPDIRASHTSGSDVPAGTDENNVEGAINVFYSYEDKQFLALVEYFINREHNEFERLKIGWAIQPQKKLWVGRYHNVLGYWNTAYHHGQYLQMSISRPAIVEFEDDGGVIPTHISGLLLNTENILSNSRLNFDLSLGYGPAMETGHLEAMNIASPGGETFHENISLRLTYFPGLFSNTQLGLFAGHTRIEGDGINVSEIEQKQIGVFGLFENDTLTILSSLFYIKNTLESFPDNTSESSDFLNAYLQLNYILKDDWTTYFRLENTFDNTNDPYLALIQGFIDEREVIGIRYDIFKKHALTLEFRRDHQLTTDINHIVLQWSALLP